MSAHAPQICDSSENRLRMLHFNRQIHTCYHNIFCCWIRYVMEEVQRNLSWKRQPYLFWFGLIHTKRKQTIGTLKMPPFCRVRLLTGDEHALSFCRCVVCGSLDRLLKRNSVQRSDRVVATRVATWCTNYDLVPLFSIIMIENKGAEIMVCTSGRSPYRTVALKNLSTVCG